MCQKIDVQTRKYKYASGHNIARREKEEKLVSSPSKYFNSDPRACVIAQRKTLLNSREKYIAFCGSCICFYSNNKPYFSTDCGIPISRNKPAIYGLPTANHESSAPHHPYRMIQFEIRHDLTGRRRIDNCKKKIVSCLDCIFLSCV